MIISRTPFRISFFGGGTDHPTWYNENKGAVISTTIDKFCYISCRKLPPFFEYKHRIVYSKQEMVSGIDEIIHPAVREAFRFMDISEGLEIHHDGDLPARAGLGSSSAFTVGLLHALFALQGKMVSKKKLAFDAIHVEQEMIKENVGSQDQVAAAFGGLNKIDFSLDYNIEVRPITMERSLYENFQNHLMLFFTGLTRTASNIEGEKIKTLCDKKKELNHMMDIVDEVMKILNGEGDLIEIGKLMDENWKLKKCLSDKVTNPYIDTIYETAIKNGAIGGKILGAGGGGFILFFVRPDYREHLKNVLNFLLHVPFRFDALGSQIIYYSEREI